MYTDRLVPPRVKARGPPHDQGGRRRRSATTVEVVEYGSTVVPGIVAPHLMGRVPRRPVRTRRPSHGQDGCSSFVCRSSWAATLAGPSRRVGRLMGCAERLIGCAQLMGRGPARPMKLRDDGPWPGPAHPFKSFQTMGGGPAHQDAGPRPGPARPIASSTFHGPAGPGP